MIFEVKGQSLKIEGNVIAEGALNYVTFRVKCDKGWKKRNITVRFFHTQTKESADLSDIKEMKSYYFPEVLLKEGMVEIGVVGIDTKGEVVTTEKKEVEIKGSLEGGATPKVNKDAYAEYVSDVLYHRKKCERAEKAALEAMKKCKKAEKSMEKMYSACQKSEMVCREILENVSGALDAIGISMRDVKFSENKLLLAESELRKGEKKRETNEMLRHREESEREKGERERRECEIERDLSEKGRIASERARMVAEIERVEKLRDFDIRLTRIEEIEKSAFPYYSEEIDFDTSYFAKNAEKLKKIRLFGKSTLQDSLIKSVAEKGRLKINFDGRELDFELKDTLRGVGEMFDELVIEKERVHVIRRLAEVSFLGDEDIVEEESEDGKSAFILPLPYDVIVDTDKGGGISTHFDFENDITISASHICLCLPEEEYPDKRVLSGKLRELKSVGKPFSLVLPLAKEKRDNVFSVNLPEHIRQIDVSEACLGTLYLERNLFETLEKLKEKIEELKKEK